MKFISLIILVSFTVFSQGKGNGHFIRTDERVDKYYKEYSPFMLNFNTGYMVHQSVEIPEIEYKNGFGFQLDADYYFFQGMYLFLSTTFSKTEEVYKSFINPDKVVVPEKREDYTYLTPILGVKYYFRKEKKFNAPWFISFGLGKNYFIGENDFNRFSAMFELGKITESKIGSSKLYYSLTGHVFEGKGFRPYLIDNLYIFRTKDFKSYISVKFNVGIHLNLTRGSIRF